MLIQSKNTYTGQYEAGSMDMALLQKLEEQTIYIIQLQEIVCKGHPAAELCQPNPSKPQ